MKYLHKDYKVVEGEPDQSTFCSKGIVIRAPFNSNQHAVGYHSENWINFSNTTTWTPISDEEYHALPSDAMLQEKYDMLTKSNSKK